MERATDAQIEAAQAAGKAYRDTEEYKTWLAKGEAAAAKAKKAGTTLVGLTITGIRSEPFDAYSPDGDEIVVLDLSDGSILYAQSDDAGNGPGILCSEHRPGKKKRQVQYYGNDDKPGTVYCI
jgi:hypothetical protein